MTGRYLTETAEVLLDAGLAIVEYDGWETRARSSGGYDSGKPWCVMWHHTASSTTPGNDAAYMCYTSGDRPIANVLIARDGVVWILAAGATNTNGQGGPYKVSRGTVPVNDMNRHAWSMELANNGVGEPYPVEQIDAAFAASIAMGRHLELDPRDICTHQAWAPSRKIDPATATAVQGPWQPRYCTSAGTWDLYDLINEYQRRWNEDDDMADEVTFKQWVRDVLNEGTGYGLNDWAGTNREILEVARRTYNVVIEPDDEPPD